jgi:RNA polymerase sigma-70 factor (ECF subfamily)
MPAEGIRPGSERSEETGEPVLSATDGFEAARQRLFGLAYRMLGTTSEAEDVLQDAWLRWSQSSATVREPQAFLARVVTRLCLDRLKSARARREVYVGPWLPEPVLDAAQWSPQSTCELADDLSFALLVALENLSPAERAAFLLRDVFDLGYDEIAETLHRSPAASRQLASRARRALRAEPDLQGRADAAEHRRLLAGFVRATQSGDVEAFRRLLADDAVAYSDGGGKVQAALRPIRGADKVGRFVFGIVGKHQASGARVEVRPVELNGLPGLLVFLDGVLDVTVSLAVRDGLVGALFLVRNPEKLAAVARAGAARG